MTVEYIEEPKDLFYFARRKVAMPSPLTSARVSFQNLSVLSRVLGAVLLLGYIIAGSGAFSKKGDNNVILESLALVSGRTLPFGCWNVVTSAFVEDSFSSLMFLTLPFAVYLTHILDPIQGLSLLRILLVTILASGTLTFVTISMSYFFGSVLFPRNADRMATDWLYAPICGFHGAIAGLFVTLKQAIPESDFTILKSLKVKMTFMPLLYVLVVSVISIARGQILKYVPLTVFGWYASWVYLRYFHKMPDSGLVGDPSDQFRFASFFPEIVQKYCHIDALSHVCFTYGMAKILDRTRPHSTAATDSSRSHSDPITDADANRRRERGMKALEERLQNSMV